MVRNDFCVYIGGGGDVFRYASGISIEGLVGRLGLDSESRGASELGDFARVARGEFSIELTEFGCEVAGF